MRSACMRAADIWSYAYFSEKDRIIKGDYENSLLFLRKNLLILRKKRFGMWLERI